MHAKHIPCPVCLRLSRTKMDSAHSRFGGVRLPLFHLPVFCLPFFSLLTLFCPSASLHLTRKHGTLDPILKKGGGCQIFVFRSSSSFFRLPVLINRCRVTLVSRVERRFSDPRFHLCSRDWSLMHATLQHNSTFQNYYYYYFRIPAFLPGSQSQSQSQGHGAGPPCVRSDQRIFRQKFKLFFSLFGFSSVMIGFLQNNNDDLPPGYWITLQMQIIMPSDHDHHHNDWGISCNVCRVEEWHWRVVLTIMTIIWCSRKKSFKFRNDLGAPPYAICEDQ